MWWSLEYWQTYFTLLQAHHSLFNFYIKSILICVFRFFQMLVGLSVDDRQIYWWVCYFSWPQPHIMVLWEAKDSCLLIPPLNPNTKPLSMLMSNSLGFNILNHLNLVSHCPLLLHSSATILVQLILLPI